MRFHALQRVDPAEAVRDLLPPRRIARPDVKFSSPQRVGESNLLETEVGVFERCGDGTWFDRGGHGDYNELIRMQRFLCLGSAWLMLLAVACGQPPAPRSETPEIQYRPGATAAAVAARPRIVFLGDSLTAGLGLPRQQSVPSLLQARLDREGYAYEVVNAGVSGDTSAGGLRRLDWALEGDVELLVLELGANDGLRGLPVAQMKENLDEIITRAKSRDITVILTGMEAPPNYGNVYTTEFRQTFRDLAEDHDVVFVPFFLEGVAGIAALNQGDGIHPNFEGAKVIEQTIWRALEPELDKAE